MSQLNFGLPKAAILYDKNSELIYKDNAEASAAVKKATTSITLSTTDKAVEGLKHRVGEWLLDQDFELSDTPDVYLCISDGIIEKYTGTVPVVCGLPFGEVYSSVLAEKLKLAIADGVNRDAVCRKNSGLVQGAEMLVSDSIFSAIYFSTGREPEPGSISLASLPELPENLVGDGFDRWLGGIENEKPAEDEKALARKKLEAFRNKYQS